MAITVACPQCATTLSLPDSMAGKKVRCQKCKQLVLVSGEGAVPVSQPPAASPPEPVDDSAVAAEVPTKPARAPRTRRAEFDVEDEKPSRRPERRVSSRRNDSSSGSALPWVLGAVGVMILLCAGGVISAGYFVSRSVKQAAEQAAQDDRRFAEQRRLETEEARKRWGVPGDPIEGPGGPIGGPGGHIPVREKAPFVPIQLPPLPEPLEIKASGVTEITPYKLPEPASTLRVGGGGRFLVLHFPKVRKLGIFDVNEAKIVRYVPASEDDVRFAAGMNKLVVYLPGSKLIQRYDLLTGDREASQKLELTDQVEAFCLGHASAGPLLIGVRNQGAKLYDIDQFKEIQLPFVDTDQHFGGEPQRQRLDGGLYWAGASGRVFGHTGNYGQPNGVAAVTFEGGKVVYSREHQGTWFVVPGPDDRHIYAAGHGVVSTRIKPVPNVAFSMGPNSGYASHVYLPAAHGPYYLHAQTIDDSFLGKASVPQGDIRLFMLGDSKPLKIFSKTAVAKYGWEGLRGFGLENTLHLIPRAKLLIVVPDTRDELRLYPADLEAALEESGRDFLVFTSLAPSTFRKGQAFTYKATAKAKKGPITYKLDSAPRGMTVDGQGVVQWAVPADLTDERVDVILAARDAGGQEVFQTFTLTAAP